MKSSIKNLINNSNSILLLTHESPDGDAIGSVLGFYHYLKSINKVVDMVILNVPKLFNFLPSINRVVDNTDREYDLGIILDCNNKNRIGQREDLFSRCTNTIVIDHHISNTNYGNVNYICENISSCCQVIYYLFKDLNFSIDKKIAECLICGVVTDTVGFSINTVDSDTFKMAADISELGVNIYSIYNDSINMKSVAKHNLMKIALDRLEFVDDGKIAWTYILDDDFKKCNAFYGDHEGIVNIGRYVDCVLVSVFARQEGNGYTVSLRSSGLIDVSKIALSFGGGGHFMAAGFKSVDSLKDTKNKIIDEIKKVI